MSEQQTSPASLPHVAGSRAFADRYRIAHKFGGGVSEWLPLGRAAPVRRVPSRPQLDRRPIAPGRDPCVKCQTRGDMGCDHRQPCDPEALHG